MKASSWPAVELRLAAFLTERFGEGPGVSYEALPGDVSTRRYFRLRDGERTRIVAVLPEPFAPAQDTFLAMRALLDGWGLPVPGLHDVDGPRGIMLLDDLGDVSLQAALSRDESGRDAWYAEARAQLALLQSRSREGPTSGPCFEAAFDEAKLLWELRYFVEHFVGGLRGCRLTDGERSELDAAFESLCAQIASWPRVVCHRDFHSRNLMLRDGRLWWIDFQDARLGPDTYDLASLLRDPYVELSDEFVTSQVAAFRGRVAPQESAAEFERRFGLTCVQRGLKALGTFGHVAHVRGSSAYSEYVPRALRSVRHHLESLPELDPLRRGLARHLEELR